MKFGDNDILIMKALMRDARMSTKHIAEKTNLSVKIISRRLDYYENKSIFLYYPVLSFNSVGCMYTFVDFSMNEPFDQQALVEHLSSKLSEYMIGFIPYPKFMSGDFGFWSPDIKTANDLLQKLDIQFDNISVHIVLEAYYYSN